uniref:BTB domain-containing protein n=1 Tax=Panagrolaimus sp. ES5 TaxID=591445 RepID=A0AC34G6C4_9BILA
MQFLKIIWFIILCLNVVESVENEILKARTKFGFFNVTFTWTVEQLQLNNFGSIYGKRILESPTLHAIDYSDDNEIYTAVIKIEPGFDYHHSTIPSLFDLKAEFNVEPKEKYFAFEIISSNSSFVGERILKTYFENILDDVEITLKVVFSKNETINDASITSLSQKLPYEDEALPLGKELLNMFESDSDALFIIECAGEEISAYKPVMKARSPVFKEQLQNDTDRLRITDFEPKIIKKMVEFCHNDSIEDFEGEETSVFAIAYKYKINSLLSYASKEIAENAKIDNAIARFKFAHFYGYEKLKKWYFNYIIENFSEVAKSGSFKTLDDELYKPILEELINQNKIS